RPGLAVVRAVVAALHAAAHHAVAAAGGHAGGEAVVAVVEIAVVAGLAGIDGAVAAAGLRERRGTSVSPRPTGHRAALAAADRKPAGVEALARRGEDQRADREDGVASHLTPGDAPILSPPPLGGNRPDL